MSFNATLKPQELHKLARSQLCLDPNDDIPPEYLEELRMHLVTNPLDINFRVKLQPGRGYGVITCLEPRCAQVSFPLRARRIAQDGGLALGFGSLEAYRVHAQELTHLSGKSARDSDKSPRTLGRAPTKTGLSRLSSWDMGSVSSIEGAGSASHMVRVKPEPVESSLLRAGSIRDLRSIKSEPTDVPLPVAAPSIQKSGGIKAEPTLPAIPHHQGYAPYKTLIPKTSTNSVKRGDSHRIPLSISNSGTKLEGDDPFDLDAIRQQLSDLQTQISSKQVNLDRLTRKRRPTKGDQTRIVNLSAEIAKLQAAKAECHSTIPEVSKSPSTSVKLNSNAIIKQESSSFKREPLSSNLFMNSQLLPPSFQNPGSSRVPIVAPLPQIQSSTSLKRSRPPKDESDTSESTDPDDDARWFSDDLEIINAGKFIEKHGPIIPSVSAVHDSRDENGDWFGRSRDLFAGPQAKADDIDKFLIEAGNAEQFDGNARVETALDYLGLRRQYDLIPGMEVALMPHQTIGVAWMCEKELGTSKGGCLGDDMGLGKTVQMIAVVVKNRSDDPLCKTNLIIAPLALLDQWKLEIELKTNCNLKCLVYHGSSKPKRKQDLLNYDIVLTTYSTMALEWPDLEAQEKLKLKKKKKKAADDFLASDSESDNEITPAGKGSRTQPGLLFQVDFYRIILDEAQAIRNKRTRASRAVTDLCGTYRWCLTGTPIINSLVDMYGYLRYLQIRPFYDFSYFQNQIGRLERKQPDLAVYRLQAVIATFLLRRMKDSMLDGKRLIELPPKQIDLVKLGFSAEEREIYRMVEARSQAKFNRYLREGTVLKNYHQVLVLLLRLRQICVHPILIQEGAEAIIRSNDAKGVSPDRAEIDRATRLISAEFVKKVKDKLKTTMLSRIAAEKEESIDATLDEECPICFDMMTNAVVTSCTHTFCKECINEILSAPLPGNVPDAHNYTGNARPCPVCRGPICAEKLFRLSAFEPTEAELFPKQSPTEVIELDDPETEGEPIQRSSPPRPLRSRGNAKDKESARRELPPRKRARIILSDDEEETTRSTKQEQDEEFVYGGSDGDEEGTDAEEDTGFSSGRRQPGRRVRRGHANVVLDSDDEDIDKAMEEDDGSAIFGLAKLNRFSKGQGKEDEKFLPSTKMEYMMEQITKLAKEKPDEKIIVVSQWTGCLALVSDFLSENNIPHVKYQGDMNRRKREQAVRIFMSNDQARIMLMSLKCGGVGLNLTRANNVICLDLGWSMAVESQAFDRVHRLGQLRSVHVQRLVISDTVEDRVLALQERKQILADGSLGEGKGRKIGKLTVKELANLFGLDHRGNVLQQN